MQSNRDDLRRGGSFYHKTPNGTYWEDNKLSGERLNVGRQRRRLVSLVSWRIMMAENRAYSAWSWKGGGNSERLYAALKRR